MTAQSQLDPQQQQLRTWFDAIDTNRSGELDASELQQALRLGNLNFGLTDVVSSSCTVGGLVAGSARACCWVQLAQELLHVGNTAAGLLPTVYQGAILGLAVKQQGYAIQPPLANACLCGHLRPRYSQAWKFLFGLAYSKAASPLHAVLITQYCERPLLLAGACRTKLFVLLTQPPTADA